MPVPKMCLAVGLLLLFAASAGADSAGVATAPAYKVLLDRPAHTGETESSRGRVTDMQAFTLSRDGKTLHSDSTYREVSYVIRSTTLKVTANGHEVRERAILSTFLARSSQAEPLKPLSVTGATIDVTLAPELILKRVDGKPIPERDMPYLKLIFRKTDAETTETDDKDFGPAGPVHVGDEWQANHALLAAGLGRQLKMTFPADHITSNVKLVSAETIGGTTYLKVRAHVRADSVPMPSPPEVQMTQPLLAIITADFAKTVPVDPSRSELDDSNDFHMTANGTIVGPDGAPANIKMEGTHHEEWASQRGK